jgi:iron complex outermembrane recepter protein
LLNGKLELSLAGFWYEIDDYQVERFSLANVGSFGVTIIPDVVTRGVEFEALARPFEGLELAASVGYTHAEIEHYRDRDTGEDLSGRRPPFVPDVTANFSAQYRHKCGVMGRVEWLLTGRTFFDEANIESVAQNAYGILNAKLGFEQENWAVYVYGKNLTDSEYYPFKLHPFGVGIIGDPRTVGMMVTLKF